MERSCPEVVAIRDLVHQSYYCGWYQCSHAYTSSKSLLVAYQRHDWATITPSQTPSTHRFAIEIDLDYVNNDMDLNFNDECLR